jgi:Tfp pilus assembly PilM family ATPase
MALSLNKGRVSPIAIDFGADTVKLLQLAPGRPPHLVAAAAETLPASARKDAAARAAALDAALKRLLKSAPFKGRRAICSIPAFQTITQHFSLQSGESRQIEEQVTRSSATASSSSPRRWSFGTSVWATGTRRRVGATWCASRRASRT